MAGRGTRSLGVSRFITRLQCYRTHSAVHTRSPSVSFFWASWILRRAQGSQDLPTSVQLLLNKSIRVVPDESKVFSTERDLT